MDEREILHTAMVNSYNVITKKKTIDDIEMDGIPVFIHFIDKKIDKLSIKMLILYFIQLEDYELCKELSDEYEKIFNEKMPQILCLCSNPKYYLSENEDVICKNCNSSIL